MAELGARLRSMRRGAGRTLKEIAGKVGFTEAYLSQVETGRTNPSLASLKRIAAGYGMSLADLVAPDGGTAGEGIVARRGSRPKLVIRGGEVVKELLVQRQVDKRMEPLLVTIEPGKGSAGHYDHAGEEFGLVLGGRLELTVEDTTFKLAKGDTFYFTSTRLHGFRNPDSRRKAMVLWVITPPSY
jgi:transcriptional regulator with XRE-family HTH domain